MLGQLSKIGNYMSKSTIRKGDAADPCKEAHVGDMFAGNPGAMLSVITTSYPSEAVFQRLMLLLAISECHFEGNHFLVPSGMQSPTSADDNPFPGSDVFDGYDILKNAVACKVATPGR